MRNHKICKKAILKFNISWRHNINDILMYNVLFVQKSSVYNASLTNFRAKKIRELATKKIFYFLFFFLSICPTYGENLKRIWDYSNSICYFDKELLIQVFSRIGLYYVDARGTLRLMLKFSKTPTFCVGQSL